MSFFSFSRIEGQKYWLAIYVWPFISTIFFVLYWLYQINYFSYIGLLIYFVPLFFYNIFDCLKIYYFLLPNISLFKLSEQSIALSSVFLLIIFVKVVSDKKFGINLLTIILLIFYFLLSFLTYLFAGNDLLILKQEVRVVIDILVVFCIVNIYKDSLYSLFENISKAFIIGCFLTGFTSIFYILQNDVGLSGYRLKSINSDPNYFSLCMAFCISLILLKVYKYKSTSFDISLIIMLSIFGLMSLSRGYLLAMIINFIIFIYLFIFSAKFTALQKIMISLLLIIVVFVSKDFINSLYMNFLDRTLSEETSEGSGRLDIWKTYLYLTFLSIQNLLFGIGIPNPNFFPSNHFSVQHNIFLELFTGKGLVGTIVVVSIYSYLFIRIKQNIGNGKTKFFGLIPIFTLFIGFMFLNGLISDIGIMTIFLGFLAANVFGIKKTEGT